MDMHNGHLAINVKVHQRLPLVEGTDDADRERVWDEMVEEFWQDVQFMAHASGYSGVFSEGRCGGWVVPFYQSQGGKLCQFVNWPGQGPDLGYPSYPSLDDYRERRRFEAFAKKVKAYVKTAPDVFRARLTETLADDE